MIVKETGSSDWEAAPVGVQPAVCVNVFDIGLQPGYQGGPPSHKVVVLWELTGQSRRQDGKRFLLTKTYTASLSEKATLRHDLEAWRSRPLTPDELEGFELDNIKTKACQLVLVSKPSNGKTFVNIETVLPKQGGEVPEVETQSDFIPDWIKKKIAEQIQPKQPENPMPFDDDIPF